MEPEGSSSCSQKPAPSPKPENLCNISKHAFLLRRGAVSPPPKHQGGGRPLSAVRDCLFNIFAATLLVRSPTILSATCGRVTSR
jgi:hypothetical protein